MIFYVNLVTLTTLIDDRHKKKRRGRRNDCDAIDTQVKFKFFEFKIIILALFKDTGRERAFQKSNITVSQPFNRI